MRKILFTLLIISLLILTACKVDNTKECDYDSKNYIGKSPDECSRIKFICIEGTGYFSDECGCGCEPVEQQRTFCEAEQRNAEICITLYDPVCGWFNESIRCIKYPCAATYSNSCYACSEPIVEYWTEGECPE